MFSNEKVSLKNREVRLGIRPWKNEKKKKKAGHDEAIRVFVDDAFDSRNWHDIIPTVKCPFLYRYNVHLFFSSSISSYIYKNVRIVVKTF